MHWPGKAVLLLQRTTPRQSCSYSSPCYSYLALTSVLYVVIVLHGIGHMPRHCLPVTDLVLFSLTKLHSLKPFKNICRVSPRCFPSRYVSMQCACTVAAPLLLLCLHALSLLKERARKRRLWESQPKRVSSRQQILTEMQQKREAEVSACSWQPSYATLQDH